MATTLTATQQRVVSPRFEDKKGNPAKVDGAPTWSTDNTDVLALEPAADGLSCVVKAVGPLTQPDSPAMVTMTADADLGEGFEPVIGTIEFEVGPGKATVVTLEAGEPTEQT